MSHPSREELVGFVYEDLAPAEHAEIERHVGACGACREQVASWRNVREALATWKLDERRRPARQETIAFPVAARWAAAAALFIASGFALARLTAPPAPDVERLRAELEQNLSVQLARHADEQRATQRAFLSDIDGRFQQVEQERLAAYMGLRQDVETVALHAQEAVVRLTGGTASN